MHTKAQKAYRVLGKGVFNEEYTKLKIDVPIFAQKCYGTHQFVCRNQA
jgi:hypothetical protein